MKLILLRCPTCSEPLRPGNDDFVLACTNCHTPLAMAVNGAVKMPVKFAVPPNFKAEVKRWMPFWVINGQATINTRETQGGRSQTKETLQFWAQPRLFYVPAWQLDLQAAQAVGSRLLQRDIPFVKIKRPKTAHLETGVVSPSDAKKMIEFIVLAIEARRRDWLRNLDFSLDLDEPELWALPEGAY